MRLYKSDLSYIGGVMITAEIRFYVEERIFFLCLYARKRMKNEDDAHSGFCENGWIILNIFLIGYIRDEQHATR